MSNNALRSQIIRDYFISWTTGDVSQWHLWFDENVLYEESVGTAYKGLEQMLRWQSDWKNHGVVFSWEISEMIFSEDICTVLWDFHCSYDGDDSRFCGASVVKFSSENNIIHLREFAADPNFVFPYD